MRALLLALCLGLAARPLFAGPHGSGSGSGSSGSGSGRSGSDSDTSGSGSGTSGSGSGTSGSGSGSSGSDSGSSGSGSGTSGSGSGSSGSDSGSSGSGSGTSGSGSGSSGSDSGSSGSGSGSSGSGSGSGSGDGSDSGSMMDAPPPRLPPAQQDPAAGGHFIRPGVAAQGKIHATPNSEGGGASALGHVADAIDLSASANIPGFNPIGSPAERAAALARHAKARLQLGDNAEAARWATAALRADPRSVDALLLRSQALGKMGQYAQAQADAESAAQLRPDSAAAWEALAWSRLRRRDYKGAKEAADHVLALHRDRPMALAVRAYAKQMLGDREGMKADIQAAAALDLRFVGKASRAAMGEDIYDPESGGLLDEAARAADPASRRPPWAPGAAGAAAGIVGLLLGGVFLAQRRRAAPPPPASRSAFKDGMLGGKYRLDRVLGRGGMGEVFLAHDAVLGRSVAVKSLSEQLEDSPEARVMLRKEAMSVAGAHHPGIVEIYEVVEGEEGLYLVFELLEGKTLHHILLEKGRLTPAEAARYLSPVCDALAFAHERGLIHRDLKPGNIMVLPTEHVKLMDFGIARGAGQRMALAKGLRAGTEAFERTRTIAGTPAYMAPEAEQGLVGRPCDIYALGVVLYELLTGKRPFSDKATMFEKTEGPAKPSLSVPGIPPALDELVASALSFSPAGRPETAAAFAAALRAAASAP